MRVTPVVTEHSFETICTFYDNEFICQVQVPNPFFHPWKRPAAPLAVQNLTEEDEDFEMPSRWLRNRNFDLAA